MREGREPVLRARTARPRAAEVPVAPSSAEASLPGPTDASVPVMDGRETEVGPT